MSWWRGDDGLATHPKLLAIPRKNRWIWIEILCYCARFRTGGRVPAHAREALPYLSAKTIAQLVELRLLEEDGENGWIVHDWAFYNPPDPTAADRMRRHRARNAGRNGDVTEGVTPGVTDRNPRARAGAPVPVPSSSTDRQTAVVQYEGALLLTDEQLTNELGAAGFRSGQIATALAVDRAHVTGWVLASTAPGIDNRGGFLWSGIRSGEPPPSHGELARPRTADDAYRIVRNWLDSPAFDAETMDATFADDEMGRVERKLHVVLANEQRTTLRALAEERHAAAATKPYNGEEPA